MKTLEKDGAITEVPKVVVEKYFVPSMSAVATAEEIEKIVVKPTPKKVKPKK